MNRAAVEQAVLRGLAKGPKWARSFQTAKPAVERLITRGLVQRVAPKGGKARNMLALTDAGLHELVRLEDAS